MICRCMSVLSREMEEEMHVAEMIITHPEVQENVNSTLVRCVELCFDCAQVCTACADACLAEEAIRELRECIRLNLDCADVCAATGALGSRRRSSDEAVLRLMLQTCMEACRICGKECRHHGQRHDHCRICAEVCASCEQICKETMATVH
jgi:hypothetical protein